jgi:ketosteroid isomerase-like protein
VTSDATAAQIRAAYEHADLDGFSGLLADDVRWGENHPNECRNRDDVLRTFTGWVGAGLTASVTELDSGPQGVAVKLQVSWVDPNHKARGQSFWHVLTVRDGRITEIRRYNDAKSAHEAING